MNFTSDVVIGLEIHVTLDTKSKLFCSCSTESADTPNTHTCPICLGHPGSKPMLNKQAVLHILRVCKALNCEIDDSLVFSRKSYFYPDMSKNFQITQFREPIGTNGTVELSSGESIDLTRIHLEEDPASLTHPTGIASSQYTLIDYNRAGSPLAEIVTKPVITSATQARDFLNELVSVMKYLDVFASDAVIKADANVSIKESGYRRVEIKNITGFKEIQNAITHEISRQKDLVAKKQTIALETRGWDAKKQTSTHLRFKEQEEEYGYIYDPDLRVYTGMQSLADELSTPELAAARKKRFIESYNLQEDDAAVMTSTRNLAELFEELTTSLQPIFVAQWLRRELLRVLNYHEIAVENNPISNTQLLRVMQLVDSDDISEKTGQQLMELLVEDNTLDVDTYVKENDLLQVTDTDAITALCQEVIDEFPDAVSDVQSGEQKALNFLVGQVMRKSKGTAQPTSTREKLTQLIS